MNKFQKMLISLFMVGLLWNAQAAERTGGQFQELLQEMNEEISDARVKIEKLDAERAKTQKAIPKDSLKKRKTALKDLEDSVEEMNNSDSPEERKAHSKAVEEKIIRVSEISADYLGAMKTDLVNQDKQMAYHELHPKENQIRQGS